MTITLIATTTMGFESVLANEIRHLGFESVRVFDSKVEFDANLNDICLVNLWLRTAGRVYIKCAEFKATSFDALYEKTKQVNWQDYIQEEDAFPVTKVTSKKSELFSKSDCQSVVKKAIVDKLKSAYQVRQLSESSDATFAIRIQIDKDTVILSIDTTGVGLNKRGYRAHHDVAPLRETLAAGLVLLSRWRPDRDVLLDPFCGTGTILIEAAMIAENRAPGLNRSFAFENWKIISKQNTELIRMDANDRIDSGRQYVIHGSDNEHEAIQIAQKNSELAGISKINFDVQSMQNINPVAETGKIISNPPYGQRIEYQETIDALYQEMGTKFKTDFSDWNYYILSGHDEFESLFDHRSRKHRKVYNGGLKCYFYQYF